MKLFLLTFISMVLSISVSANALEISTGAREIEMRNASNREMTALSAALQTAFNALSAKVMSFDTRIAALEAWRPIVTTSLTNLWIEVGKLQVTANWLRDVWRPHVEGRLASLEARPTPLTRVGVDAAACTTIDTDFYGSMVSCPANYVMVGVKQNGLATGSKKWYGTFKCCMMKLY